MAQVFVAEVEWWCAILGPFGQVVLHKLDFELVDLWHGAKLISKLFHVVEDIRYLEWSVGVCWVMKHVRLCMSSFALSDVILNVERHLCSRLKISARICLLVRRRGEERSFQIAGKSFSYTASGLGD